MAEYEKSSEKRSQKTAAHSSDVDLNVGDPDDRIHMATPGDDRKIFRSATPRGFTQAVFEANSGVMQKASQMTRATLS